VEELQQAMAKLKLDFSSGEIGDIRVVTGLKQLPVFEKFVYAWMLLA
jgi:hypothetical protein